MHRKKLLVTFDVPSNICLFFFFSIFFDEIEVGVVYAIRNNTLIYYLNSDTQHLFMTQLALE